MSTNRQATRKDDAAAAPVEVVDLCSDDEGGSGKENGVLVETSKPAGGKRKLSELELNQKTPSSSQDVARAAAAAAKPPPHIWMNDDQANVTYGVLPLLQKHLQNTNQASASAKSKTFLLTNSTLLQHIQQRDGWSCGFRNIQMLLSALIPLLPSSHPFFEATGHIYAQVPEHVFTSVNTDLLVLPSLMQLQMELETSWKQGFDPAGAKHFQHSVVGRPSKIGAIEVGFLLAFWKIDAHVLQFVRCVESRRLLPASVFRYFQLAPHQSSDESTATMAQKCMKWAEKNWDSKSTAREILNASATTGASTGGTGAGTVLPLYLQWEGHSVTIIGIEPPPGNAATHRTNDWNQWNLLILCPNKCGTALKKASGATAAFRMSCRSLGRKDCQVLVAGWNALSQDERLARQKNAATTTAALEAAMRASREF